MIIERELLVSIYESCNGDIFKTASELGQAVQTIIASLNKHKIPYKKPTNIYHQLKGTDFSPFQKSIIAGCLFSGGFLRKNLKSKNAFFVDIVDNSLRDWERWKFKLLNPFVIANNFDKEKALFSIMSHPFFTKLYFEPEYLHELFDFNSFIVFYMDNVLPADKFFSNKVIIKVPKIYELGFLYKYLLYNFKGVATILRDNTLQLSDLNKDEEFFLEMKKVIPNFMYRRLPQFPTNTKRLLVR